MLLLIAFCLGACMGWFRATRRGGDRLDKLQYAAAHGIFLTLVALAASILFVRIGV